MRLDDKDELHRGVYKYWYACDKCNTCCTVNEESGEIWWDESLTDDDIPL